MMVINYIAKPARRFIAKSPVYVAILLAVWCIAVLIGGSFLMTPGHATSFATLYIIGTLALTIIPAYACLNVYSMYTSTLESAEEAAFQLDDTLGGTTSTEASWTREVTAAANRHDVDTLRSLMRQISERLVLAEEWVEYREETKSMGVSDTIDRAFTTRAFSDLLRPGSEQGLREAEVEFIMMSAVTELAIYERFRASHPGLPKIPVDEIMMDKTERQLSLEDLVSLTEWSHTLALMTALPFDFGFSSYGDTTVEFLSGEMSRDDFDLLNEHVHRAIILMSEIDHIQEHSDAKVIKRSEMEDLRLVDLQSAARRRPGYRYRIEDLRSVDVQSLEAGLEKLRDEADLTWNSADIEQVEPMRFKELVRMSVDTERSGDWRLIEAADADEMDDALGGFGINRESHVWLVYKLNTSVFAKALALFTTNQRTRPKNEIMLVFAPWVPVDGAKFNTIDGVDHVYHARSLADQGAFDGISRSEFGVGVPPFTPPTARQLYRDELMGT